MDWVSPKTELLLQLQPFYSSLDFIRDNQKKHSPTHTYRGHQSSLICFLHLLGILLVQFTCLTVFFHNFSPKQKLAIISVNFHKTDALSAAQSTVSKHQRELKAQTPSTIITNTLPHPFLVY